ncbi:MAG: L-serine ammonia-lyase, iron-sulfur-dependent, subunit alpha [archaeon]
MTEIVDKAVHQNKPIHRLTLEYEMETHGTPKGQIISEINKRIAIMYTAAKEGVSKPVVTKSGLVSGNAYKFFHAIGKNKLLSPVVNKAVAYSLAVAEVNAAMGIIVAAPTAGSCGVIPGALFSLHEEIDKSEEKLVNGFLTASGVGLYIANKATFAASVAGCAAEIGASTCMAAATITEFLGGTPKQAVHAGAIALKSYMGLACDPVAGLVEVPCIKRNAIGVSNAFTASQMALNGVESAIPFSEVIDAMYRIGKNLPVELRETSKGGLAKSPTGIRAAQKINNCAIHPPL